MPERVIDVLHTPWTPLSVFAGHAVTLAMSLGFLLLHRERQEHEIERLAMTDELTAVYNRRSLFDIGDKEVSRARRTGASLSALLLDLDHFKRVNDKYGHLGGDAVLVRFVEVVRGCLRTSDILARYGGEEFLILLPTSAAPAPRSSPTASAPPSRRAPSSSAPSAEDHRVRRRGHARQRQRRADPGLA